MTGQKRGPPSHPPSLHGFTALSLPAARVPLARLVDGEVAAAEVLVVQAFDRDVGRLGVHLDEPELSRTTGVPVGDEFNIVNSSVRLRVNVGGIVVRGIPRVYKRVSA